MSACRYGCVLVRCDCARFAPAWSLSGFCWRAFGVKSMSFSHVIAFAALVGAGLAQAADPPAQAAPPAAAEQIAEPVAVPEPPEATAKPGDATAGHAKSATCAACHGMDGNPASSQYPKLAGQQETYTARQVQLFKSHK